MKNLLLTTLFFLSFEALALEAVVTVLEAPLFKENNYDAPVVQYKRKGDVIKIHPSVANTTKYDHMAPDPEKYKKMKERLANRPEWKDPMFKEDSTHYLEDEFIPTLDRQGNKVYILAEHIYVYFNDTRELTQTIPRKDPTDYRLEEPLPKNYPLYERKGIRGQVLLGFSQPHNDSYPYPGEVKSKSYRSPIELNVSMLKQVSYDTHDKFFYGGVFQFRTFENSFYFIDQRSGTEKYLKFGVGPIISYDAFKGEKNRVNLSASICAYFLNRLAIEQADQTDNEQRIYRSMSLSPRISIQYHRKKIVNDLDFVLAAGLETELPNTFTAQDGAGRTDWWQNIGEDEFRTKTTFSMTAFIGIQSAY